VMPILGGRELEEEDMRWMYMSGVMVLTYR